MDKKEVYNPIHDNDITKTAPRHYTRRLNGEVRRIDPKVKGKAAVKAAKRARRAAR